MKTKRVYFFLMFLFFLILSFTQVDAMENIVDQHSEQTTMISVTSNNGYQHGLSLQSIRGNQSRDSAFGVKSTYKVIYKSNGGTSGHAPVDMYAYWSGTIVKVLGNDNLSNTGKKFTGWNTSPNGKGIAYQENDTFIITDTTVLYAQWEKAYKVTYNTNGGNGIIDTDETESYIEGEQALVLPGTQLTFSGKTFIGWNTEADGTGVTYQANERLTMSHDVVLYAQWQQTFTLTYDANGATGTVPVDLNSPYCKDEKTVVLPATNLTFSGKKFIGWNTKADGTGVSYQANQNITMKCNVVLYAQWQQTYTITYDANGATGEVPIDLNSPYCKDDRAVILSANNLTYAGKIFTGWNTKADGTGLAYTVNDNLTVSDHVVLYAQWKSVYTVTYYANGAKYGSVPIDAKTYFDSDSLTVLSAENLSFPGKVFIGWNTKADGTGVAYKANESLVVKDNVVLYAQWQQTYTITYDANGAIGDVLVDEKAYYDLDSVTVLGMGNLSFSGKAFVGWNTKADGTGMTYQVNDTFKITETTHLYAQWRNVYSVTYHADGAVGTVPEDSKAYFGSDSVTVMSADNLSIFEKAFIGWNTKADGTGMTYQADEIFAVNANVDLYAQWQQMYKVIYDANGATGTVPVDASGLHFENDIVTILPASDLTFSGKIFIGWNTMANGTGMTYHTDDYLTVEDSVVLYAQWRDIYHVIYHSNGATFGNVLLDTKSYQSAEVAKVLSANNLSILGKAFIGWNTKPDGTGVTYQVNDTFKIIGVTNLYAQWRNVYTVTYDANGAAGIVPKDGKAYFDSDSVTVLSAENLSVLKKAFIGWNTHADGSGVRYQQGDQLTMGEDITLYAQWKSLYSMTYDANGATGTVPVDDKTYFADAITTVFDAHGLSFGNKVFSGWNSKADGSGTSYQQGDLLTIVDDTTLYAQWKSPDVVIPEEKNNQQMSVATSDDAHIEIWIAFCFATVLGAIKFYRKTQKGE